MPTCNQLITYLDSLLPAANFPDSSKNGLQVDAGRSEIRKVGVAVDSGLAVIEAAIAAECQLLVVHHGLFWGQESPIAGVLGDKVRALIKGGCSLYASHLPLDGNRELGNNAELARFFNLELGSGIPESRGEPIGFLANANPARDRAAVAERAREMTGAGHQLLLPFGPEQIKTVALVSGGAAYMIPQLAALGADLFITGEPKQASYHQAREAKINVLFAGHYATETFGVRAVAKKLAERFGVATEFIDIPTGI